MRAPEKITIFAQQHYEKIIDSFIAQQDVAVRSRATYKNALRQFFRWLQVTRIYQPTQETILAYKEYLDHKGLQPFSRATYLVAVRKFFAWTERMKLYPHIARDIRGTKNHVKHHLKSSLTVTHVKALLASIDKQSIMGMRDYALINVLIRTGLRLIEIINATIADLCVEEHGVLLWIRGKGRGGKDDFVLLTDEALDPIIDYLRARRCSSIHEPIFASLSDRNYGKHLSIFSVSRMIKAYLRSIGLDSRRYTAHSLRHTFGVLTMQAGASLYEIQLAMRHANPATTELYLGDIERQKRIEAAPERLLNEFLLEKGV